MQRIFLSLTLATFLLLPLSQAAEPAISFRMQEIDRSLKVGYAVLLVDLNGDAKKDIVVVDTTRVIWFENPTWKLRTIISGGSKPDNVCLDAADIDGDGQLDLALGADWKPFNTKSGGTLQWLKRGATLEEPWSIFPIDMEPTIHRIRFADLDGDGRPELLSIPLMGRNSTKENNWTDGDPNRCSAYRIPSQPQTERWPVEIINHSLHVIHNFHPIPRAAGPGQDVLIASYEGVSLISRDAAGAWQPKHIGAGNQANPKSNRGASEIKQGTLKPGRKFIATIEPWHGHQVVVYTPPAAGELWTRHVIDEQLKWGHAVSCADLDGDGADELIIGVRDNLSDKPGERSGVRVFKALDEIGAKWSRQDIDPAGVAVEDLAAADLDGNGKPDIVAVGRATGNVRIYWTE